MLDRVEQLNQMNTWFNRQYGSNLFEGCNSPADVAEVMRESLQDMDDEERSGFSVWLDYYDITFQELITHCEDKWSAMHEEQDPLPEGKVYGISISCPACWGVSLYEYRENNTYRCSKCGDRFTAHPIDTSGS